MRPSRAWNPLPQVGHIMEGPEVHKNIPRGFCEAMGYFIISERYIEDITRWLEDMNFMLEWQEQYLTRSLRSLVRYCSCHSNIKFISSSHRVMFFLLYGD